MRFIEIPEHTGNYQKTLKKVFFFCLINSFFGGGNMWSVYIFYVLF